MKIIDMGNSNCSKHKKEVAGISDMKELAEMIGDLHYETLADLLYNLHEKFWLDSIKDMKGGRRKLGSELFEVSAAFEFGASHCRNAWQISKPFMTEK